MLVAGAAAGMSATFATPVAAILLAVELLLFEWRPRSLVPVAIAVRRQPFFVSFGWGTALVQDACDHRVGCTFPLQSVRCFLARSLVWYRPE